MDERTQYIPPFTYTYRAADNKIGIKEETIVREAADRENAYKNLTDVPVESVEGEINFLINRSGSD